MRQRKLGSHTPPCHRRMVITTLFSVGEGGVAGRQPCTEPNISRDLPSLAHLLAPGTHPWRHGLGTGDGRSADPHCSTQTFPLTSLNIWSIEHPSEASTFVSMRDPFPHLALACSSSLEESDERYPSDIITQTWCIQM